MQQNQPASIPVDQSRGAILHTAHVERTVKVYGILESELKSTSLLNSLTIGFSSVGSFLLAVAVSIVVGWQLEPQHTETGNVLLKAVAPLLGILALLAYTGAIMAFLARRSDIARIESESVVRQ